MDGLAKLEKLGADARHDLACGGCKIGERTRAPGNRWIYPSALPDGRTVNLMRVLQTNACLKDCFYCAHRAGRKTKRESFQPEELAKTFMDIDRTGVTQGIFLSSGVVKNADYTQERLLATVETLRQKYGYQGYIHLKLMPGASKEAVERSMRLADRVSINLEAPTAEHLTRLSGTKDFNNELLRPMQYVAELMKGDEKKELAPMGHTTQFVVGAVGESDQDILQRVTGLYKDYNLARAYFSAFQPVPDTPLDGREPTPLLREHRLYQTDYLFRKYGFTLPELTLDENQNLPLEADPKMLWALRHPEEFPKEVNVASKEELLRIPGIGPRSVTRIIRARKVHKIQSVADLDALGAVAKRAAPFILLNGKRPDFQMGLFDFSPQSDAPWVPGGEPLLPLTMPVLERLGVEVPVW